MIRSTISFWSFARIRRLLFKDFKKQLANGTIKIANSEREYLMKNRPKYRAGVVEQVWANATSTRGRVFDPNPPRLELFWNKNQDRDTQWHMGHRHGKEYRKLVDEYAKTAKEEYA